MLAARTFSPLNFFQWLDALVFLSFFLSHSVIHAFFSLSFCLFFHPLHRLLIEIKEEETRKMLKRNIFREGVANPHFLVMAVNGPTRIAAH